MVNHAYFHNGMFEEEYLLVIECKKHIGRIRESAAPSSSTAPIKKQIKLPTITLPTFDGVYAKWPEFRDLFIALVINNENLSEMEQLHYLRLHTTGPAAAQINGFPFQGESFHPAWDALSQRYENPRLMIQERLDQLFNLRQITRNAQSLNALVNTVTESVSSIMTLGMDHNMWDCILAYHVAKQLDKDTRERWEQLIASSQEYPRLDDIIDFLTNQARALERVEATNVTAEPSTSTNASKSTKSRQATTHHATTAPSNQPSSAQSQQRTKTTCALCKEEHWIVSCPQFFNKTPSQRRSAVIELQLCYNCLGYHSIRNCTCKKVCRTCGAKHHTMLHDAVTAQSSSKKSSGQSQPGSSTQH